MLHCGRFMKRITSKQDGLCFLFCFFLVEIIQDHRRAEDSNSRLQQIGQFVQKHLLFSFSFFFHFSNWYCFTQLILLTKRANIVVCLLNDTSASFSNDEHKISTFSRKKMHSIFFSLYSNRYYYSVGNFVKIIIVLQKNLKRVGRIFFVKSLFVVLFLFF